MVFMVKFITIPETFFKEIKIEVNQKINLNNALQLISAKSNVDFIKNPDNYMFMLNGVFIPQAKFKDMIVKDSDAITIFPMISGG